MLTKTKNIAYAKRQTVKTNLSGKKNATFPLDIKGISINIPTKEIVRILRNERKR